MKKVLSIVAVAAMMLFAGKANAQLSIHAGWQNYTLKSHLPVVGTSSEVESGFYAGVSYAISAGKEGFDVNPGIYFAYLENVMDIRVPILASFTYHVNDLGFGLFVGPQLNVGIAGDMYKDGVAFNRLDVAVSFGGQISWQQISLEVGYNLGLLNRWKDAPSDCSMKANQLFLGLGFRL